MPEQHVTAAVVGVGRMGRHHARTYAKLPGVQLVGVVDPDEDRAGETADTYATTPYPSIDALLADHPTVTGVSVATPTQHHAAAAEPLLRRGIACLIEKPIAQTSDDARRLRDLADQHDALLQVGHTERFNPAIRAVAALGLTARFVEVDRVSPMTFRSLDVGVVMDMMIHDLDIVLTLVGSPIKRVDAASVPVLSTREDICDARLVFDNGCVANLTASRLALKTERKMRLFSESAYVSLDYQNRGGMVIQRNVNEQALAECRRQIAAGADLSDLDWGQLVQVEQLAMDLPEGQDDPLTAQATNFLAAARGLEDPVVTAAQGIAAVAAAEQVLQAAADHHWEGLTPQPLLSP
jgi:predicted dehydrogenase